MGYNEKSRKFAPCEQYQNSHEFTSNLIQNRSQRNPFSLNFFATIVSFVQYHYETMKNLIKKSSGTSSFFFFLDQCVTYLHDNQKLSWQKCNDVTKNSKMNVAETSNRQN